jgi:hypothetical protein
MPPQHQWEDYDESFCHDHSDHRANHGSKPKSRPAARLESYVTGSAHEKCPSGRKYCHDQQANQYREVTSHRICRARVLIRSGR